MLEYDPPDPESYFVCCPYCGSIFSIFFTETFTEVRCLKCARKEEWHKEEWVMVTKLLKEKTFASLHN